jgi:hypothetical protein
MPSGRSSGGNSMPPQGQLPPVIVTREGSLLLIWRSHSVKRPVTDLATSPRRAVLASGRRQPLTTGILWVPLPTP